MYSKKNRFAKIRRAFSLLEIMAVVVIMGLLVGAVAVGVRGQISRSRVEIAKKDILHLHNAIVKFEAEHGELPSEDQGLYILLGGEKGDEFDKKIQKPPIDPWGNEYGYQLIDDDDNPFLIVCYGSDGIEGGTGLAADFTNLDP